MCLDRTVKTDREEIGLKEREVTIVLNQTWTSTPPIDLHGEPTSGSATQPLVIKQLERLFVTALRVKHYGFTGQTPRPDPGTPDPRPPLT